MPDPVLREEIMNQEVLKDGYLTEYEISRIQSLLLTGKDVHNLKGIEILKSLRYLYVGFCPVEEIDVSKCEKLQVLYCYNSSVTKINTSGCNSLTELNCKGCWGLSSLSVSMNSYLNTLNCEDCNLSTLWLCSFGKLQVLECSDNPLAHLDLSYITHLKIARMDNCDITWLDLSNIGNLQELSCTSLESVNLRWNPNIKLLTVGEKTVVENAPEGVKITRKRNKFRTH